MMDLLLTKHARFGSALNFKTKKNQNKAVFSSLHL